MEGTDPIILDRVLRRRGSGRPRLAALSAIPGVSLHDALVAACEVACLAMSEMPGLSRRHALDREMIEAVLDMVPTRW